MEMKRLFAGILASALTAASFGSAATVITVAYPQSGVMPVLVTVDKSGKITRVLSTERLKPSLEHLLRNNLQEMIQPTVAAVGKGVASQFVVRVRLNNTPRVDGAYDVQFVGVEAKQVPMGNWYWLIGDNRYALSNYQSGPGMRDSIQPRDFQGSPRSLPSTPTPAVTTPATTAKASSSPKT